MHIANWIGCTIIVRNYRGDGQTRLIRVIAIRDIHEQLLRGATRARHVKVRGRILLTGIDLDRDVTRAYYVDQGECYRVRWFGRQYHKLLRLLGYRWDAHE